MGQKKGSHQFLLFLCWKLFASFPEIVGIVQKHIELRKMKGIKEEYVKPV